MIKKLLANVGSYKKDSLLTPVYVAGEVALDVIMPLIMAMMIDQGIEKGDAGVILRDGGLLFLCSLIALLLGTLGGRTAAIASAGFARNLRHNLFRRIQDFSFSNIDRFSSSSLITRLTTDVTNVQNAYQMIIRILVRSPLVLIFSLAMVSTISPELMTIYLVVLPILAIGLALVIRFAHPLFLKVFRIYDRLNNVVQENLQGVRVVKSYVREEQQEELFGEVSTDVYRNFTLAQRIVSFNMPLMQFAVYTCMLLLSWFGAQLIVEQSSLTTGELVSMFNYTMQILMSLMMMSMAFVQILIARTSAERVVEVLDEESDLKNPAEPVKEIKDGSIIFENVGFSYANDKNKLALIDANLRIESGEVIGIIGGTGSGKSTLVQLIPRLYDVIEGRVIVGGHDVRDYDLEALRDQVSMVLQNNVLFSGTINDNLRWGNEEASDEEIQRVATIAQADPFIQEFPDKYETQISQGGNNVSGGQKQRLTIARALLKKPKILILDDSTSAVDTKTDRSIREGLKREIPGTTTIIISQRINSIEDADRIIVMDDGKINGIGTHEELLANNAIYQEVYHSQQKGFGEGEE
ncbi:ABC transporter ATP-binding protein [Enterococcus sp. PF-2]|jgi:ATP-binding cassette subfamily B protein|uniref:ABC transporter ATP-binding protein n=1 Tax=Enterococcus TaxID=1350 RepID=UPI0004021FEB|nr:MULTISPECIES: ABC transporter ATP-binding protein [unclassified Enterococcus]AMG48842.1 ABC transporter ATP-binding protein [Enterococcus gallinarum]MBE9895357.1 ABC transporter ATP-binding protein [Enterococcus casseliflavus]AUJ86930.1 ABC transporter ATP-binding protein [Enterococcus sp. CR-Ec1]MBF0012653.1 ABC transporter ATP-binding protein [Enterococcus casseliflavus]MBO1123155.1 ABC transporter ATP-binding protein [Enterococcus casseliflavus]